MHKMRIFLCYCPAAGLPAQQPHLHFRLPPVGKCVIGNQRQRERLIHHRRRIRIQTRRRLGAEEHHADHALDVQTTEYIRNHIDTNLSIAAIAAHMGYNPDYLGKCFRRWHGVGLKEYIANRRMQQAKNRLLTTTLSVKEIAASLGYREENRFIKFFLYHEGISPTAFRTQYCHTHINSR